MVPKIVMKLRVGKMALKNVTFLVCDDKMTNEPIIIGRPVLEHLRIDTKHCSKKEHWTSMELIAPTLETLLATPAAFLTA